LKTIDYPILISFLSRRHHNPFKDSISWNPLCEFWALQSRQWSYV